MGDFFHGWRRKTGIVTLVMALVLMGGWVRSFQVRDVLNFRLDDQNIGMLESNNSRICWGRFDRRRPVNYQALKFYCAYPVDNYDYFQQAKVQRRWKHFGFDFVKYVEPDSAYSELWHIPYWSVVIPLTMLSTWLLLSKPRKESVTRQTPPATG